MESLIQIRDLSKKYGNRLAVESLNLDIYKGDIFGFVGPNGAGKTSTIRMITGLLQPSGGEIIINGHPITQSPQAVLKHIGYMPDYFGTYPELKVWEYLDFFGACYQIPDDQRSVLIKGLLELVELTHRREDRVDSLSRGMKQRVSLARTLLHDPEVLVLDEPAAGLDPRARIEIRELLVELAKMGKTIFFSTHILSDVAEICTRIGIIEAGKLVAVGDLEELHLQSLSIRVIDITILDQVMEAQRFLEGMENVHRMEILTSGNQNGRQRLRIEFSGDDRNLSHLLAHLIQEGIPVLHFSEDTRDLEKVFMQKTKGLVT